MIQQFQAVVDSAPPGAIIHVDDYTPAVKDGIELVGVELTFVGGTWGKVEGYEQSARVTFVGAHFLCRDPWTDVDLSGVMRVELLGCWSETSILVGADALVDHSWVHVTRCGWDAGYHGYCSAQWVPYMLPSAVRIYANGPARLVVTDSVLVGAPGPTLTYAGQLCVNVGLWPLGETWPSGGAAIDRDDEGGPRDVRLVRTTARGGRGAVWMPWGWRGRRGAVQR